MGDERQRVGSVVENALAMDLAVGLGITDRFSFHLALPFVLGQGGGDLATVTPPDSQAVGDMDLVLRGHVVTQPEETDRSVAASLSASAGTEPA